MAKYDPKLLKKISQSQLISAAAEMDVKNADRISKEMLINAFLEKVEAADTNGEEMSNSVISMYNTIGEVFDLLTEPAQEEVVEEVPEEEVVEEVPEEEVQEEETPEEVQEETPEPEEEEFVETPPEEEPIKEVKQRMVANKNPVEGTATLVPKKVALAPKVPGPIKPMAAAPAKKAPAPPKKTSKNRFFCAGEAVKSKKYSGTVQALVQLSDDIHVKSGGKTNLKEATTVAKMALNVLVGLGAIKVEGDKFSPVVTG